MTASATSPTEIVRSFIAAVERKDYDTAMSFVADDCEYDNVPLPDFKVTGPEAVRGLLEPFFAPTLENELIVLRIAADGPLVFVERLDRHLLPDGWLELPVTGMWEVHDGRITLWRDYFNLPTIEPMLAAAG